MDTIISMSVDARDVLSNGDWIELKRLAWERLSALDNCVEIGFGSAYGSQEAQDLAH